MRPIERAERLTQSDEHDDYVALCRSHLLSRSVEDDGIGIPSEHQQTVFEALRRRHGHGEFEGSGLGLATCFNIVQQHRGRIWVESEVDAGTSFYFTLRNLRQAVEAGAEV